MLLIVGPKLAVAFRSKPSGTNQTSRAHFGCASEDKSSYCHKSPPQQWEILENICIA
jgi:hypothetical protein